MFVILLLRPTKEFTIVKLTKKIEFFLIINGSNSDNYDRSYFINVGFFFSERVPKDN